MMRLKYIKLFEETDESPTWSTVRDTIQAKKSFVIFVFKDESTLSKFKEEKFTQCQSISQTAFSRKEGKSESLPSLFYILDKNTNPVKEIKTLFKKYSIISIVYGENGGDYSRVYSEDGSHIEFGNELVSELSEERMASNFFFKIDSIYYTFLDYTNY